MQPLDIPTLRRLARSADAHYQYLAALHNQKPPNLNPAAIHSVLLALEEIAGMAALAPVTAALIDPENAPLPLAGANDTIPPDDPAPTLADKSEGWTEPVPKPAAQPAQAVTARQRRRQRRDHDDMRQRVLAILHKLAVNGEMPLQRIFNDHRGDLPLAKDLVRPLGTTWAGLAEQAGLNYVPPHSKPRAAAAQKEVEAAASANGFSDERIASILGSEHTIVTPLQGR